MSCQLSFDFFGILFGYMCSRWHLRLAYDIVASKQSIFSQNHNYSIFLHCVKPVGTYTLGSICAWCQNINRHTEIHTHTHTHTHTQTWDRYDNTHCACALSTNDSTEDGHLLISGYQLIIVLCQNNGNINVLSAII